MVLFGKRFLGFLGFLGLWSDIGLAFANSKVEARNWLDVARG